MIQCLSDRAYLWYNSFVKYIGDIYMLNARASCEFGRLLKVVLFASKDSLPKLSKDECEFLLCGNSLVFQFS